MKIRRIPPEINKMGRLPVLMIAVILLAFTWTVRTFAPQIHVSNGILSGKEQAYKHMKASNGVELYAVAAQPEQIGLKAIDKNVTDTGDNGINGGFFWQGNLLSIAVFNDKPVKGASGDYGSGWYNSDRPRGTLVWDGGAKSFSVQVAEGADELKVTDRSHYWAQGGVSMGLHNEDAWKAQALSEEFPAMEENRLRTGMVYDSDGKVWLLVTNTPCTGEGFRDAVLEKVAPGKLADGIFLDGDGSSQLKLGKLRLPGDKRPVYQMVTLTEAHKAAASLKGDNSGVGK